MSFYMISNNFELRNVGNFGKKLKEWVWVEAKEVLSILNVTAKFLNTTY